MACPGTFGGRITFFGPNGAFTMSGVSDVKFGWYGKGSVTHPDRLPGLA